MTTKNISEDRGELFRCIGPEINNALAVILGNAQLLLLNSAVAPEAKENLRAIERSSYRIQTLVDALIQGREPASLKTLGQESYGTVSSRLNVSPP